ncbi:MAG: hypothetical protein ACXVRN_03080 [Solirubrobacteraceae bacterium]
MTSGIVGQMDLLGLGDGLEEACAARVIGRGRRAVAILGGGDGHNGAAAISPGHRLPAGFLSAGRSATKL